MEKINHLSQLDLTKVYSYADYLQWRLEETVELIRGIIFPDLKIDLKEIFNK